MEFEGIVSQVLEPARGVSSKGEWVRQDVVFEQTGDFGKKICVSFWGDKAHDVTGLVPGERVKIAANVESREYNGRWYTDVRAWKLDRNNIPAPAPALIATTAEYDWSAPVRNASTATTPPQTQAPMPTREPEAAKEEYDDLPF